MSLDNIPTQDIVDCLHDAFSDYFVPLKASHDDLTARWDAARINYALSFGYFDKEKLTGFILHGIDRYEGHFGFFNMATGVIPDYRGRRIIKQLYDHALPLLQQHDCSAGFLEVITDNVKAIKAYKSVGFSIIRDYQCYQGRHIEPTFTFAERLKNKPDPDQYKHLVHHHLCWEQNDATINQNRELFQSLEIWDKQELIAFAIVKLSNTNLVQFGVRDNEWNKFGRILFGSISKNYPDYRILNIDPKDQAVYDFLNELELPKLIRQYEMQLTFQ